MRRCPDGSWLRCLPPATELAASENVSQELNVTDCLSDRQIFHPCSWTCRHTCKQDERERLTGICSLASSTSIIDTTNKRPMTSHVTTINVRTMKAEPKLFWLVEMRLFVIRNGLWTRRRAHDALLHRADARTVKRLVTQRPCLLSSCAKDCHGVAITILFKSEVWPQKDLEVTPSLWIATTSRMYYVFLQPGIALCRHGKGIRNKSNVNNPGLQSFAKVSIQDVPPFVAKTFLSLLQLVRRYPSARPPLPRPFPV